MQELENNPSFATLIIGLVFGILSIFIVLMIIVFVRRVIAHQQKVAELQKSQSRELLLSTIQTQENERKKIGANIHDDIGPLLSLLKLQLHDLNKKLVTEEQKDKIEESKNTLDDVLRLVRSVSNDLSPSILNELGLNAAVTNMLDKFNGLSDAKVEAHISPLILKVGKEQSLAVYRIVQESLTNIIRHSKANKIVVKLNIVNQYMEIFISDNGIGFNDKTVNYGLGINNIKARVESFGGECKLSSSPEKGTCYDIKMKIRE